MKIRNNMVTNERAIAHTKGMTRYLMARPKKRKNPAIAAKAFFSMVSTEIAVRNIMLFNRAMIASKDNTSNDVSSGYPGRLASTRRRSPPFALRHVVGG